MEIPSRLFWIAFGVYSVIALAFESWLKWYLNTQGRGGVWLWITPWDENYLDQLIRNAGDPFHKARLKRLRLLHYALLIFPILAIIAADLIERALS